MKKGWKRVHRLVVLPDYQGIGIGKAFINGVSDIWIGQGYEMSLITTTPSLVHTLRKSPNWILKRYGRSKGTWGFAQYYDDTKSKHLGNQKSCNRITYSFKYIAKDKRRG